MNELLHFRAREQMCRQCAAFEPERTWHWLAEADMWKYKAQLAQNFSAENVSAQEFSSSHFKAGNTTRPTAPEREAI